jgi:UDP-N-acetylmuramoyl-tripeptide--D-alanyl-D-alanine ligase
MNTGWTYTSDQLTQIIGANHQGDPFTFNKISTDTRTLEDYDLFFALSGENFDGNTFVPKAFEQGAIAAITTHQMQDYPCLIVDDVLTALQALAKHHRAQYQIPILAITGSCGKTSSKDMIAALLATKYKVVKTQGNLNNAIGCPLSIMQIDSTTQFVVLEMGANHIGEIAELCQIASPTESVITMIAAAHLEGFGTIEDIAKAKSEIAQGLPKDGTFYINTDDPRCNKIGQQFTGNKITYGQTGTTKIQSCTFDQTGEMILDIDPIGTLELPLYTKVHAQNALLAITIALHHEITQFQTALRIACLATTRFKISEIDGIEIIDDTYNANPASMQVAIEALANRPGTGKRIAVLGSMGELGPDAQELHTKTGTQLGKHGINTVLARGDYATAIIEGAKKSGVTNTEIIQAHQDMANRLKELVQPGDSILFKGSRRMTMERVIQHMAQP